MNKKQFIKYMTVIQDSHKKLREFSINAAKLFPDAFDGNLSPTYIDDIDQYAYLLIDIMKDEDEWIFYYMYDLNFGKEYKKGMVKTEKGNFELKTFEDLYEIIKFTK